MKKELEKAIERIRSGKSAIHNDDRGKCKEALGFAFPKSEIIIFGLNSYYYRCPTSDGWDFDDNIPPRITHFYEASELYRWIKESEAKKRPISLKNKNQKVIDSKFTNYDEVRILTECAENLKNIGCGTTEKTIKNILKTRL